MALAAAALHAQKFFPDDPLRAEPRPMMVASIGARDINDYYDFFQNTFFDPSKLERRRKMENPSKAVNTLGEVPDSAWFTNRIGTRPMTLEELVRGPGDANGPAPGPWMVIGGKNQGVTPGLTILDSRGRKYLVKFDPESNPEMASAVDVIGSKFFHDLGYNTPENYIVTFDRNRLRLGEKSTYHDPAGHKRPMTEGDIDAVMRKVPRNSDGTYRGMASLYIPGQPIGPFRYYGTRTDDPNDVVSHEDRRDLRGLYVFAAWLNHTDSKSINSLDSLVEEDGVKYVKHFLIDFGAILGSDSFEAKSPRAGNVFLFDFKPAAWQFLSLGLYVPSWMRADYPNLPAAGHLEAATFDPERWRNNYPNPAFELHNPGDAYWAAKKVMAFSDEAIRGIVATGKFSDPRATEWISRCIIERRDRIGRAFLNGVLALDSFAVRGGVLEFEDLAAKYGFHAAREYVVDWSEFDNRLDRTRKLDRGRGFEVPRSASNYLAAEIRSTDQRQRVTVYLRGNQAVGIDRTW